MTGQGEPGIAISVVIPTFNRPDALACCVAAVLAQRVDGLEVVIANDGTIPVPAAVRHDARVVVLDGPFGGPAAARNAAVRRSRADLIAFTDDDTVPQAGWLSAALAGMDADPDAVGMVGQVDCPPYDPVFQHAVQAMGQGNFLTCNAVYRRWALEAIGGFDERFPYPHCEDRDLGYRMSELGPVPYNPTMRVHHPARGIGMRAMARRGRFVASEWRLYRKHPQSRPQRWSVRWAPVIRHARSWRQMAASEAVFAGGPARAARFVGMAAGEVVVAAWTTVVGWSREQAQPVGNGSAHTGPRVAYVTPSQHPGGTLSEHVHLTVEGLTRIGCRVDLYLLGIPEDLRGVVPEGRGTRVICVDTGWRRDRWYSDSNLAIVLSGSLSQAIGQLRMSGLLEENHRNQPYDAICQWPPAEIRGLSSRLDRLPPIVMEPEPDRLVSPHGDLGRRLAHLEHRMEGFGAAMRPEPTERPHMGAR